MCGSVRRCRGHRPYARAWILRTERRASDWTVRVRAFSVAVAQRSATGLRGSALAARPGARFDVAQGALAPLGAPEDLWTGQELASAAQLRSELAVARQQLDDLRQQLRRRAQTRRSARAPSRASRTSVVEGTQVRLPRRAHRLAKPAVTVGPLQTCSCPSGAARQAGCCLIPSI